MTADPAFRLSTYLALGLACAALGAAEFTIFPEVGVFAVVVVVALAVVYRLETRIELLTIPAANNLGIGIALAGAAWAAVRLVREARVGEFASLGWAVFFVLLLAPVLMAAVVALLLRREKDPVVYWYLHSAALGAVVLAAAIARQPWEIALLVAYAGAAVWALTRFTLARSGAAPATGRRTGLAAAGGLLFGAVAVSAPVFALTPASPWEKFEFGPGRIEVGFGPEQIVDLNRTGELTPEEEPAFTVAAEQDGRPKDDLPVNTRWRSRVLSHYINGGWRREATFRLPAAAETAARVEPWSPPRLGPGAYLLHFSVPGHLRSDFLAEPVVWRPGQAPPVADVFAPPLPPRGWYPLPDGSFLRNPARLDRMTDLRYVQYTAPLPDPDLGVGFLLMADRGDPTLVNNPVLPVRGYTSRLLARLVREGKLPPEAGTVDAVRLRPPEAQHEAVARAFCRHLAESPEFTYTLTMTRTRPDLDPVEEFLEHTRTGHCSQYASALVLMLRSQGIPAALALGFKGHEAQGEGRYLVRQSDAHAWAIALVSRPDTGGGRVWHWLSLDPTPGASRDDAAAAAAASDVGWKWVWKHLLDATPEERLTALGELASHPLTAWLFWGGIALAALTWTVRRVRAGRGAAAAGNPWLDPLLAVLARYGVTPEPGETPREFATRVSGALAARPGGVAVAGVPPAWVDAYYQERFGGTPVAAEGRASLDAGLVALRSALSASPPGGTR
jgi:transglutaminase-like putative cysteine protease